MAYPYSDLLITQPRKGTESLSTLSYGWLSTVVSNGGHQMRNKMSETGKSTETAAQCCRAEVGGGGGEAAWWVQGVTSHVCETMLSKQINGWSKNSARVAKLHILNASFYRT